MESKAGLTLITNNGADVIVPSYNLLTLYVREMVIWHLEWLMKTMNEKLKGRHSFKSLHKGKVYQLMNLKLI